MTAKKVNPSTPPAPGEPQPLCVADVDGRRCDVPMHLHYTKKGWVRKDMHEPKVPGRSMRAPLRHMGVPTADSGVPKYGRNKRRRAARGHWLVIAKAVTAEVAATRSKEN